MSRIIFAVSMLLIITVGFASNESSNVAPQRDLHVEERLASTGRIMYYIGAPLSYVSVGNTLAAFAVQEEWMAYSLLITGCSGIAVTQTGLVLSMIGNRRMDRKRGQAVDEQAVSANRRCFIIGELAAFGAAAFMTAGTPLAFNTEKEVVIPFACASVILLVSRDFQLYKATNGAVNTIRKSRTASMVKQVTLNPVIMPANNGGGLNVTVKW